MTTAAAVRRAGTSSGTDPVQEVTSPLKQRIAFVSGGMGGIGTAVCRRLARTRLGNAKFKSIEPAPGRYVRHRIV